MKKKAVMIFLAVLLLAVLVIVVIPEKYEIGDISKDGEITILDLLIIQKHVLGLEEIPNKDLQLADFNGDGYVNEKDVEALQNYLLGIK
ncbi:hypothetical protein HYG86_09085 [Alkalicella caledoniensis]|uniref:Dockerin domain-containing protein n=1 Tax=Alkalicella caledoniensis TaxID=2731377 RepID=A0A7G9W8A3_ALKCA|nr:dockerin type I repeat-containing protein [Alkalicella caledoniensis]QNO14915.1 hypothetical protein HYG86_09085 [Alkalicella caledoniensis]